MSELLIKLKTPFEFEGEEIKEIDLSGLENLKGLDLMQVQRTHAQRNKGFVGYLPSDQDYCLLVASKATGLPVEMFEQAPAKVYNAVCAKVMVFLNSEDSE